MQRENNVLTGEEKTRKAFQRSSGPVAVTNIGADEPQSYGPGTERVIAVGDEPRPR